MEPATCTVIKSPSDKGKSKDLKMDLLLGINSTDSEALGLSRPCFKKKKKKSEKQEGAVIPAPSALTEDSTRS